MRDKKRWRSLAAWALAFSMAMGNSGVMVMAESTDGGWVAEDEFTAYPEDTQPEIVQEETQQEVVSAETGAESAELESAEISDFGSEMEASGFEAGEETAEDFISDGTEEIAAFTDDNDEEEGEEREGYFIEVFWTDQTNKVNTNNGADIPIGVVYEWNEDGRHYAKSIEDYTLKLIAGENGELYDSEYISEAEITESSQPGRKYLSVSTKENPGTVQFSLEAVVDNEEKTTIGQKIEIEICDLYYKLMPAGLDTPEVGSELDFSGLYVEVMGGDSEDGSDQPPENVEYRVDDYNRDVLQVEEDENGIPVSVRRISPDDGWITFVAYVKNEEGDDEEICRRSYGISELEYPIWFDSDRDEIFNDEESFEVPLNVEELENRDVEIQWQIGYSDNAYDWSDDQSFTEISENDVEKFWSIDYDAEILTVNGEKLAAAYEWLRDNFGEEYKFAARVFVMANTGNEDEQIEVNRCQIALNTRETVYDYHLDEYNEWQMMVDEGLWINRIGDCWVENAENWDGGNLPYEITSVSVDNAEGEGDTPVCSVKENEYGWDVIAERPGAAVLTIHYKDLNEEEQSFSGNIHVDKDIYYLEVNYSDDDNRMLTNDVKEANLSLHHQWAYSEEDRGDETVRDFKVELLPDQNGNCYDEDVIYVPYVDRGYSDPDKWFLRIESKDREEWTSFMVQASVEDEEGNWIPVAEQEISVDIMHDFCTIEGELPENILLGETFEFDDYKDGLKLTKRSTENGWEEIEISDLEFYWNSDDSDAWEEDASTGKLLRKTTGEIRGTIRASYEETDGEEQRTSDVYREVVFGALDYYTYFKDMRSGEYATEIFEDEQYELTLDSENLADKNVKIQWEVGYCVEEGENTKYTPVSQKDFGSFWSEYEGNQYMLLIDGKALKEAYESLHNKFGDNSWFDVNAAIVSDNEYEMPIDTIGVSIFTRDNVLDYGYPAWSVQMLPGEEFPIENSFDCYEENSNYPFGHVSTLTVKNVTVEGEEAPITVEKKDDHWIITANSMGDANVILSYTDIDGTLQEHTIEFYVTGEIYAMAADDENGASWILNGEEMTIPVKVYRQELDENGSVKITEVSENAYTLNVLDDEDSIYDTNILDEVSVEGSSLVVRANARNTGATGIAVNAVSAEQENGEPVWEAYCNVYVNILEAYYTIYPVTLSEEDQNLNVNDTLDLNQYDDLSVKFTTTDEKGEKVTTDCENVRYILNYDEEQWECVDDSEELLVPILKRITDGPTWLNVIAEEAHEDRFGNIVWENVATQGYSFERILDKPCSHDWEVTEKKDATCTAEGSILYTCTKCNETKTDIIEKLAHNIVTVVDSQPTCGEAGKQHQECSVCHGERKELEDLPATGNHDWKESKTTPATCTAEGSKEYTCSVCGQTKSEAIEKIAHNIVTVVDSQPTCGAAGKQHQECSVCHGERKELEDLPATGNHDWKESKTTLATCTAEGSKEYTCSVCGQTKSEAIKKLAHNMVTVVDSQPTCGQVGKQHKECSLCHGEITALGDLPATGKHTWGDYVRKADPTAATEGLEERTCSVCGSKETRAIAKLTPFVKVSSTSFPMKKSQSVKLPVTLEKGDSIKSAVSSNKKKLTVSVKGNVVTLKAAKKATKGTVKVTITTTCGATQTVTVKLQGSTVQAKKITGISKKLTLKVKKKATLKPVVTPISYQNKITYKSSKTKIATVSKKGVIKAKKAGKTTITVTCGKVKVKCTVTVKK